MFWLVNTHLQIQQCSTNLNPSMCLEANTLSLLKQKHQMSFFLSVGGGRAEESAVFSSRRPAAHTRPLRDHHLHCVQRVCEYLHIHPCVCLSIQLFRYSFCSFLFYLQQVILECSLDSCFSYIYQYEPYMKDSVGFPKVMVSSAALGLSHDLRCTNTIWYRQNHHIFRVLVDAGVNVLCFTALDRMCLWALHSWMHVDVGLDAVPRRSCRSGKYTGTSAGTTKTTTKI